MTHIIRCDSHECDEHYRYNVSEDKHDEGWLEVWTSDEVWLDFCSRGCLVDYYTEQGEDD